MGFTCGVSLGNPIEAPGKDLAPIVRNVINDLWEW